MYIYIYLYIHTSAAVYIHVSHNIRQTYIMYIYIYLYIHTSAAGNESLDDSKHMYIFIITLDQNVFSNVRHILCIMYIYIYLQQDILCIYILCIYTYIYYVYIHTSAAGNESLDAHVLALRRECLL